eukprot:4855724-Amphidinium_carterae.2
MVWAQLGPEFAIDRWTQWLIVKFRAHADRLYAAKRLYDAATWKVALLMRNCRKLVKCLLMLLLLSWKVQMEALQDGRV